MISLKRRHLASDDTRKRKFREESDDSDSEDIRSLLTSKAPLSRQKCYDILAQVRDDDELTELFKRKLQSDYRTVSNHLINSRVTRIDELVRVVDSCISYINTGYKTYKKTVEEDIPKIESHYSTERKLRRSKPHHPPDIDIPLFKKVFDETLDPYRQKIEKSIAEHSHTLQMIEKHREDQPKVIWQQFAKDVADEREQLIQELSRTQMEMRDEFVGITNERLKRLEELNYRKTLRTVEDDEDDEGDRKLTIVKAQAAARVARNKNIGLLNKVQFDEGVSTGVPVDDSDAMSDLLQIQELREGLSQPEGAERRGDPKLASILEAAAHDPMVSPLAGFSDFIDSITRAQFAMTQLHPMPPIAIPGQTYLLPDGSVWVAPSPMPQHGPPPPPPFKWVQVKMESREHNTKM